MKTEQQLLAEASAMFESVTKTIKNESVELANKAEEVIKQEVSKLNACIAELKRRGKCSIDTVNLFIQKCLGNLKDLLSKVLGMCKELWNKVLTMFSTVGK